MEEFGFRIWQGSVNVMPKAHQHAEIEFNVVQRGQLTYLFGGKLVQAKAGGWIMFWGAMAHALTAASADARCLWLTLPLDTFLRFDLPAALSGRLLQGEVLEARDDRADARLFARWCQDAQIGGDERERIISLELQARLRRYALRLPAAPPTPPTGAESSAQRLAHLISSHYTEDIDLPTLAAWAGLHVNYASGLFRQTFGMTMLDYLLRNRLAHAQRLLVTTSEPVLDIAFDSGFQSASAFYAAFQRATGQTPRAYRRSRGLVH